MPLSSRLALPLAVIVLMGATVIARANVTLNLCKLYCDKKAAGEKDLSLHPEELE